MTNLLLLTKQHFHLNVSCVAKGPIIFFAPLCCSLYSADVPNPTRQYIKAFHYGSDFLKHHIQLLKEQKKLVSICCCLSTQEKNVICLLHSLLYRNSCLTCSSVISIWWFFSCFLPCVAWNSLPLIFFLARTVKVSCMAFKNN